MTPAIHVLKICLVFVCLLNLASLIAFQVFVITITNKRLEGIGKPHTVFAWTEYGTIALSGLLFISYGYSIWGKPMVHRFIRAALLLHLALFLICTGFQWINHQAGLADYYNNETNMFPDNKIKPFSCENFEGTNRMGECIVTQCHNFAPIVTGFIVVIEVLVTLICRPLPPTKFSL
ncbi:hypothetical protein BGZ95_004586 [Linnemannia exigua]|uniref:Uncharacterized protein n=1 Tax=Linnemannia exigua TaxID=604196 RepID=A0AAD4D4I9_9FUNG|nr:hypothetical protein BGZ95_004586 [Linnemannia exigua]